jgi:hypothetical protein
MLGFRVGEDKGRYPSRKVVEEDDEFADRSVSLFA